MQGFDIPQGMFYNVMDQSRSLLPLLLFALVAQVTYSESTTYKILIYPMDNGFNSRLMNLVKIADILNDNGHNATVLVNARVSKTLEPRSAKLLIYDVPNVENLPLLTDPEVVHRMKNFELLKAKQYIDFWISIMMPFCDAVFGSNVVHNLKSEGYDLIIIDNLYECGRIMIEYLDVPSMMYSNFGFTYDPLSFYPMIPSFMCNPGNEICSSDKMSFGQRVANFLQGVFLTEFIFPKVSNTFQYSIRQKYNLNASTPHHMLKAHRSPIIVNGDFVLDYPRPLMPHVLMIPGLFHKASKPLPTDLKYFIEGSAPHGVVVLSFGSIISEMESEKAEIFAKVLGQLPQRVIWRYTGLPPKSLGKNTKLVSWFPQADVLRHPLTKLFITHCGISGTYEAALSGLPVIAIPLFADQEYNSRKLTDRGKMGVHVSYNDITEQALHDAVTEVLNNHRYLINAQHVSSLLRDEEMPAKERLLYWVGYTIRHNGAKHLVSETALSMTNFVFYSVDVLIFLACIFTMFLTAILIIPYCIFRYASSMLRRGPKSKLS